MCLGKFRRGVDKVLAIVYTVCVGHNHTPNRRYKMTNATATTAAELAYMIRNMRSAMEKLEAQLCTLEDNAAEGLDEHKWLETAEISGDHLVDALATLEKANLYLFGRS